jgi:hypothetical protein
MTTLRENITLFTLFQQGLDLLTRRSSDSQPASAEEQVDSTSASLLSEYRREWPSAGDPWLEVARYQRSGRLP